MRIALVLLTIATLSACGPTTPSEADKVRALPAMSMDRALSFFRQVCVNGGADTSGGSVLFERPTTSDGTELCTMRARTEPGVDAFQELRRRYGSARASVLHGVLTQFAGFPGGPLIFLGGALHGAGEGTYQVAVSK